MGAPASGSMSWVRRPDSAAVGYGHGVLRSGCRQQAQLGEQREGVEVLSLGDDPPAVLLDDESPRGPRRSGRSAGPPSASVPTIVRYTGPSGSGPVLVPWRVSSAMTTVSSAAAARSSALTSGRNEKNRSCVARRRVEGGVVDPRARGVEGADAVEVMPVVGVGEQGEKVAGRAHRGVLLWVMQRGRACRTRGRCGAHRGTERR